MAEKSKKLIKGIPPVKAKQRRLPPDGRESLILAEAIKFFADVGLEGRTRDLAKRIGVTQPLLYRYFPNKESLIERVYEEVYIGRLKPDWSTRLVNRQIPLYDRLIEFYTNYQLAISNYEWVRIFLYSGLRGEGINKRYMAMLEARFLVPIYHELRAFAGKPDTSDLPAPKNEMEIVWSMHSAAFMRAVRKYVYELDVSDDSVLVMEYEIRSFLENAPKFIK